MSWEVEFTHQFEDWWDSLSNAEQESIVAAVEVLETSGPNLGRPFVDRILASRHANMKELRPRGGNLRILFAFDPRRMAILLIGGDKTHLWQAWYERFIPVADQLFDDHLRELKDEGLLK